MTDKTLRDARFFLSRCPAETRLIGLDLGTKTIGIALSDKTRCVAAPLCTLERRSFRQDFQKLQTVCADHAVGGCVIGLPLNMNGTYGPRAQSVRDFVRNFQTHSDLPVLLWDERLSSVAVTRILVDANLSRKKQKKTVDKMAAAFILQGFLEAR